MTIPEVYSENALAVAMRAPMPESFGHTILTTKRPVLSIMDIEDGEAAAIWRLMQEQMGLLTTHTACHSFDVRVRETTAGVYWDVVPQFHTHDPFHGYRLAPYEALAA
jgi:diadenosine tetraphosphate (Ap4A) HIT family hydrolase